MKIDLDHAFELAVKWGLRSTKPPIFNDDYANRLVEDLKRFMEVQRMQLEAMMLTCASCGREYPMLPDLDACPFCAHAESGVTSTALELVEAEPEELPIKTELERSKEQMLQEYLEDIESLGKKSIKALWEIGNRFMLIKQNKLHLKDEIKISDFAKWCEARTGWHYNTVDKLIRFHRSIPLEIIENAKRIQVSGLLAIDKIAKVFPSKKKEILAKSVSKINAMPQTSRFKNITAREAEEVAKDIARKIVYNEDGTVQNPEEIGIAVLSKGYVRKDKLKNYYGKNTKSVITKIPIMFKTPYVLDSYDSETVANTPMEGRILEVIFPATSSILQLELTKYGAICTVKQTGKRLHHKLIPEAEELYLSLEEACERKTEEQTDEED